MRAPLFSAVTAPAFPGVYARQAPRAGATGLVGFAGLMLTLLIFGVIIPGGDLLTLPRALVCCLPHRR